MSDGGLPTDLLLRPKAMFSSVTNLPPASFKSAGPYEAELGCLVIIGPNTR